MTAQQTIEQAARLRYKMQINSRLRLETMAALSKVFRDHEQPIHDELLASLVLAVPQELLGEAVPGTGMRYEAQHGKPAPPPPPPTRHDGPGGKPSAPPPQHDQGGKPSAPPAKR